MLYGFNHGNSIDAGKQWLDDQYPDVVALQELNGNTLASLAEMATGWQHHHSAILKEKGFPVGLTSNKPVEVIERRVDGFHHGFLHARTHGIHFFVVHFWPGKEHEARTIADKIQALLDKDERVLVLGDFNSHSRKDAEFLEASGKIEPRYSVVDLYESQGFVDLVNRHDSKASYSAPSPITIPRWSKDLKELKSKRQRIDFVFAGPKLEMFSTSGTIIVNEQIEAVSDHYPVIVEFEIPE